MKKQLIVALTTLILTVSCGKGDKDKAKTCKNPISFSSGKQVSLAQIPDGFYKYKKSKVYASVQESGARSQALITEQVLEDDLANDTDVDIACNVMSADASYMSGQASFVSGFLKHNGQNNIALLREFSLDYGRSNIRATFSPSDSNSGMLRREMSLNSALTSMDKYKFYKINKNTYELRMKKDGMYLAVTYVADKELYSYYEASDKIDEASENLKKLKKRIDKLTEDLKPKEDTLVKPDIQVEEEKKEILLEQEEVSVTEIGTAKVVVRDYSTGKVESLNSKEDAATYARNNGYNPGAASDGFLISAATGGITGFSPSSKYTANAITDMLAHIKSKMNENNGDLDLAFVIDYSGSMDNDIEAVISGLNKITYSLQAIIDSGRTVRTSIVTFGEPRLEKVELDFTKDMSVVRTQLERLLNRFGDDKHSIEPGEAWYHGMKEAAKTLTWASENRSMITITDEESNEVARGMTDFVNSTTKLLTDSSINVKVYNIIVK